MTDKTCEFEADLTPSSPLCRENWPRRWQAALAELRIFAELGR